MVNEFELLAKETVIMERIKRRTQEENDSIELRRSVMIFLSILVVAFGWTLIILSQIYEN